jgi:hypothetical protein
MRPLKLYPPKPLDRAELRQHAEFGDNLAEDLIRNPEVRPPRQSLFISDEYDSDSSDTAADEIAQSYTAAEKAAFEQAANAIFLSDDSDDESNELWM